MKIKKKKKNYSIWLELKEITFLACIAIIYNQKNKTTHKKIIRVIGNIPEAIIMMIFVCLFLKRIIKKKMNLFHRFNTFYTLIQIHNKKIHIFHLVKECFIKESGIQ